MNIEMMCRTWLEAIRNCMYLEDGDGKKHEIIYVIQLSRNGVCSGVNRTRWDITKGYDRTGILKHQKYILWFTQITSFSRHREKREQNYRSI